MYTRKLIDSVLRLCNVVYISLFGRPFLKLFKFFLNISVYSHCVQHVFCPPFLSRMPMSLFITAVLGTCVYMHVDVLACIYIHLCSLAV